MVTALVLQLVQCTVSIPESFDKKEDSLVISHLIVIIFHNIRPLMMLMLVFSSPRTNHPKWREIWNNVYSAWLLNSFFLSGRFYFFHSHNRESKMKSCKQEPFPVKQFFINHNCTHIRLKNVFPFHRTQTDALQNPKCFNKSHQQYKISI